jgi:hypothetical protein
VSRRVHHVPEQLGNLLVLFGTQRLEDGLFILGWVVDLFEVCGRKETPIKASSMNSSLGIGWCSRRNSTASSLTTLHSAPAHGLVLPDQFLQLPVHDLG